MIIILTRKNLAMAGISITRGSFKNSKRYLPTFLMEGLSGVPKFINNTPVFEFIFSSWTFVKKLSGLFFNHPNLIRVIIRVKLNINSINRIQL